MPTEPAEPTPSRARRRPRLLLVVATCTGLEALGVLALATFLAYELATGTPADRTAATLELVGAAALAIGLGACSAALAVGKRWSRAPLLTWQIVSIPVGISLVQQGRATVGIVVVVLAVVAAAGLLSRPVLEDLGLTRSR